MDEMGESELYQVPISAIEHHAYCPRQCALIHVEGIFADNLWTVRGNLVHEKVHAGAESSEGDQRQLRGLPLISRRWGLVGKADLVEIRPEGPFPVEYKAGRHHGQQADMQLCAQALCLEEMYGCAVPRGALYHAATRTRQEVELTEALRQATLAEVAACRQMLQQQQVPPPVFDRRCQRCSLRDECLPEVITARKHLQGLQSTLFQVHDPEE